MTTRPLRTALILTLTACCWLTPQKAAADPLIDLCQNLGDTVTSVVRLRDLGKPPSFVLQSLHDLYARNKTSIAPPLGAFQRWMILFAYDMEPLDAAYIRQRVETKCFQTFR